MRSDNGMDEKKTSQLSGPFPGPVVGIAGVVIHNGSLLLIQRGSDPGYGMWSIPGGKLKFGESLREGVEREIREECGIDVVAGDVLGVFDLIEHDDDGSITFHYVLIDLEARYRGGEIRAGSDALDVRWVPFRDVRSLPLQQRLSEFVETLIEGFGDE
jgi:ADP-ribose pyrophosphatase YjhB (NUDIX family)